MTSNKETGPERTQTIVHYCKENPYTCYEPQDDIPFCIECIARFYMLVQYGIVILRLVSRSVRKSYEQLSSFCLVHSASKLCYCVTTLICGTNRLMPITKKRSYRFLISRLWGKTIHKKMASTIHKKMASKRATGIPYVFGPWN